MDNRTTLEASLECIEKLGPYLRKIQDWMEHNPESDVIPVALVREFFPIDGAKRDIENIVGTHGTLQLLINQIFTAYPELAERFQTEAASESKENQIFIPPSAGDLVC
jgi:hemerythrin-like domain-containing protein